MTTVAIAGASGFVGRKLISELTKTYQVIGLSRKTQPPSQNLRWRSVDLFSLSQSEGALEGVDIAIYLVHSMVPSAKLTQANFQDLDLIVADNFARAARKAKVKQIIYLGGLLPQESTHLSRHLSSRLEVEQTLRQYGTPLTTLRAGLIVGPGGSSFLILERLIKRLPAMLLPGWTSTLTQPVALDDVVKLIAYGIENPRVMGETFDIGTPEPMTYREMIQRTAHLLGFYPKLFSLKLFSPHLSKLWVSLVTQAPMALSSPLIESLCHTMVARDHRLYEWSGIKSTPFNEAVTKAISEKPGEDRLKKMRATPSTKDSKVRSVQRMKIPPGMSIASIAQLYFDWLGRKLFYFLKVKQSGDFYDLSFRWLPLSFLQLRLDPDWSSADRQLFRIVGGVLSQPHDYLGRFEFRSTLGGDQLLIAIHDFSPRLPWWLYVFTQAKAHLALMRSFRRYLNSSKVYRRKR